MIPSCIASSEPHSFAAPLRVGKQDIDVLSTGAPADVDRMMQEYLRLVAMLSKVARHLWATSYGSAVRIRGSAIIEETLEDSTVWWLLYTKVKPSKLCEEKKWLKKHLGTDTEIDVDDLLILNPWLQRRFGWGDVRTTTRVYG